jgi:hypothetical protein
MDVPRSIWTIVNFNRHNFADVLNDRHRSREWSCFVYGSVTVHER